MNLNFPDRVPVIIESRDPGGKFLKYMVPRDRTFATMMVQLRKHIDINSKQAIFLFVNGCLPPNSKTIGEIYDNHKNENNVLHVMYALENTFG